MSKKKLIMLVVSVGLTLALVLSSCAQQAAPTPTEPTTPTTPTTPAEPQVVEKQVDRVYRVLNPQGTYIPVECKPLAPRLDSLAGKKILYYESDATDMYMPALLKRLKKDYPTATFDIVHTETWGLSKPTAEHLTYQACIRGVGW